MLYGIVPYHNLLLDVGQIRILGNLTYHTYTSLGKLAWHVDVGKSSDDSAHKACGIFW